MNYDKLGLTIKNDLQEAVSTILNPEIDPETRRFNLEILLREVGSEVYYVIYSMVAYDMEIEYTVGAGINDAYYGLAKVLSDSVSVGGRSDAIASLDEWLSNQILKAEFDAFTTAFQSGKYPIAVREEPFNCCAWCRDHTGTFIDPSPEVFRRHDRCRGEIRVSGYRSRNGTLSGRGWKTVS